MLCQFILIWIPCMILCIASTKSFTQASVILCFSIHCCSICSLYHFYLFALDISFIPFAPAIAFFLFSPAIVIIHFAPIIAFAFLAPCYHFHPLCSLLSLSSLSLIVFAFIPFAPTIVFIPFTLSSIIHLTISILRVVLVIFTLRVNFTVINWIFKIQFLSLSEDDFSCFRLWILSTLPLTKLDFFRHGSQPFCLYQHWRCFPSYLLMM